MSKIKAICEKFFDAEISYNEWVKLIEQYCEEEVDRRVQEEIKWREELGKEKR